MLSNVFFSTTALSENHLNGLFALPEYHKTGRRVKQAVTNEKQCYERIMEIYGRALACMGVPLRKELKWKTPVLGTPVK